MIAVFFRFYYRRELGSLIAERKRLADLMEMLEKRLLVEGSAVAEVDESLKSVAPAVASLETETVQRHRRQTDGQLFSFTDEQRERLREIMVESGCDHITMESVDLGLSKEGNEAFVRRFLGRLNWFETVDGIERMHARGGNGGSVASEAIAEIIDQAASNGWSPLEVIWRAVLRYHSGPGLRDGRLKPLLDYLADTLDIANEAAVERKTTTPGQKS